MADDITVDNGDLTDFAVSADDASGKLVQRVKLTYSADGSATHIPADADGLLVNLGSNNDISGTVTVGTALPAGTNAIGKLAANSGVDIGDVDVTSLPALAAGTAEIGKVEISDGTTQATVTTTGGTHEGVAVALIDNAGAQLAFAAPSVVSGTVGSAQTYAAGDAIGTVISFASAASSSGGTGHILRCTILDLDDLTHDGTNGRYRLDLYSATVSVTDGSSYIAALDDTEAGTYIGSIDTDDAGADGAGWVDLGTAKAVTITTTLPLPYECAATTLFAVLVAVTLDSGATTADGKVVKLHLMVD